MLPVIFGHTPAGASTKQFIHFAQLMGSGRFQRYDFESRRKNYKHYGKSKSPRYNLGKVNAPVHLHYSSTDATAPKKDVLELKSRLPNVQGAYELSEFTHIGFIYSVTVKKMVYDKIVDIIKNFDSTR